MICIYKADLLYILFHSKGMDVVSRVSNVSFDFGITKSKV